NHRIPNYANPIDLNFSPRYALGSFGSQFHSTLGELRTYQAKHFRSLITHLEGEIKRIEIGDHKITDQIEIRRVTSAVKLLDERAFAFTESERYIFSILVYAGQKRPAFLFFYVKEPPDARLAPEKRPLPSPLWEYYVDVVGSDIERAIRNDNAQRS